MPVNTMGPMRVSEAFVDNVAASQQKKIITISSGLGSIKNSSGKYFAYRSSKAAVNMVMATLAAVVVMSGYLSDQEAAELTRHGVDDFVRKPFEMEQVRDLIFRLLKVA